MIVPMLIMMVYIRIEQSYSEIIYLFQPLGIVYEIIGFGLMIISTSSPFIFKIKIWKYIFNFILILRIILIRGFNLSIYFIRITFFSAKWYFWYYRLKISTILQSFNLKFQFILVIILFSNFIFFYLVCLKKSILILFLLKFSLWLFFFWFIIKNFWFNIWNFYYIFMYYRFSFFFKKYFRSKIWNCEISRILAIKDQFFPKCSGSVCLSTLASCMLHETDGFSSSHW